MSLPSRRCCRLLRAIGPVRDLRLLNVRLVAGQLLPLPHPTLYWSLQIIVVFFIFSISVLGSSHSQPTIGRLASRCNRFLISSTQVCLIHSLGRREKKSKALGQHVYKHGSRRSFHGLQHPPVSSGHCRTGSRLHWCWVAQHAWRPAGTHTSLGRGRQEKCQRPACRYRGDSCDTRGHAGCNHPGWKRPDSYLAVCTTSHGLLLNELCAHAAFSRNIVATVNLDCRLDLKTIALHARNAEYNPKVWT